MTVTSILPSELADGVKLNLGAGDTEIDGFTPVDRKLGREVYPLDFPDESVSIVRASHVLEHFSHREIGAVVAEWVRVLEPGGILRVAVPDFELIARAYLEGLPAPVEGYVMGGHVDENDRHGAIFDYAELTDVLARAGLIGVSRWRSEVPDCASLPISLNLQGVKPPKVWPKTSCVMSVPRLGFMDNAFCLTVLQKIGIAPRKVTGAFWGQCLTRGIEQALDEDAPEWILTVDYDSLFTANDVLALLLLAQKHPEIDALAPLQMHRRKAIPLFTLADAAQHIDRAVLDAELLRASTAHFGLTLIRASKLRELPPPWFIATPDDAGGWGDGRTDDDVHFWRNWDKAGNALHIACRVPIGHAELMVQWPNINLETSYAHASEFWDTGKPEDIWR